MSAKNWVLWRRVSDLDGLGSDDQALAADAALVEYHVEFDRRQVDNPGFNVFCDPKTKCLVYNTSQIDEDISAAILRDAKS